MANHRSAEKANRQAQRHRIRNVHVRSTLKTLVKKVHTAIESKDGAAIEKALKSATKAIDQAAAKDVIHRSTASRKIAGLARLAHRTMHPVAAPAKA